MIGGEDIVLSIPNRPHYLTLILQALSSAWPGAQFQLAESVSAVPFGKFVLPTTGLGEVFIYRDAGSYAAWSQRGATVQNQDAMMHVIVEPNSITIVVDRLDSNLGKIARELLDSVPRNRFQEVPAHREKKAA
jgi:hypothetical protein